MQCTGNSSCFPRGKASSHSTALPFFPPCVLCFRVFVIHWSLTWTTRSLTCVGEHSYACVCTRGWGTPTTSQHNILTRKQLSQFCLCSGRDWNLWPWNPLDRLEVDAQPIEPPRTPLQYHHHHQHHHDMFFVYFFFLHVTISCACNVLFWILLVLSIKRSRKKKY